MNTVGAVLTPLSPERALMFNLNHPEGYKDRSLSVSDVVEVMKDPMHPHCFYFCDSVGFKPIDFEPKDCQLGRTFTDTEKKNKYYQFVDAATKEQFDGYIQRAKEKAFYDTSVSAEYGDKLITLSTCEYSGQNSRLVVVAKKVTESGGSNAPSNDGATEIQS